MVDAARRARVERGLATVARRPAPALAGGALSLMVAGCGLLIGVDDPLQPGPANSTPSGDASAADGTIGEGGSDGGDALDPDASSSDAPSDAAAGRTVVIAIGDARQYAVSFDLGVTWPVESYVAQPDGTPADVLGAGAFGAGKFVAVGGDYGPTSPSLLTTNGNAWTTAKDLDSYALAVAYGAGMFVTGNNNGDTFSSTDGANWLRTSSGPDARSLVFANGRFIAGGDGDLWWSTDGFAWAQTKNAAIAGEHIANAAIDGSGNVVFVSSGHAILTRDGASIVSVQALSAGDEGRSVAYGQGHWLTSDGWTSSDGKTWASTVYLAVEGITFADGYFFAFKGPEIFRSANGVSFTRVHTSATPGGMKYQRLVTGTF